MTDRLLQMSGVIVDLIYQVEKVPAAGEEASVTGFSIAPGGGFNAMVAAKRAGMHVSYGGSIGTGPFAEIAKQGLQDHGIPTLQPQDTARDQGCSTVLVDTNGERTFIAKEGADGHVSTEELALIDCSRFDWVLLSGYALYYEGSRAAFHTWLEADHPMPNLVFDPSPMVSKIPSDVLDSGLRRASWISANAQEAAILTGHSDPAKAAAVLAARCPPAGGAVVRNGAHGCVVAASGRLYEIPAYLIEPVDTTGAGDTHLGSFIAQLSSGKDPVSAAEYANIAAALSTMEKGPATAPEPADVYKEIKNKEAV